MHYNLLKTKTGRLQAGASSAPPREKFFDMRTVRPKGSPITRDTLSGRSGDAFWYLLETNLHSERRTLLNADYRTLEQHVLAFFNFNSLHKYSYEFKKPQDVRIIDRPIELNASESFRVEITMPSSSEVKAQIQNVLEPTCGCAMRTLMRTGCQCGGI